MDTIEKSQTLGFSSRPISSPLSPTSEPVIITLKDLGPSTSATLARFCNDPDTVAKGFWQCRIADYSPSGIFTKNGIASFPLETDNDTSRVDFYMTEVKPSRRENAVFHLQYTDTAYRRRPKMVSFTNHALAGLDNINLFSADVLRRRTAMHGQYYIGDWSCLLGKPSSLLSCGPRLESLFVNDAKPGITTSYLYYAEHALTGSGMHIEDLAVPSMNMVRWGAPKQWLFVTPEQENVRAFEKKCRETFPWRKQARRPQRAATHCSQFVRHANVIVTTEALRDWGIDFSETICREGELVVTLPGTYHQVVNMGENLAEAVNVMWGNCGQVQSTYVCCSRDGCGHTGGVSQEDLTPEVASQ
ncbi:hypothetical protein CaCOL14_012795 [Colletotrichum acutatum]